MSHAGSIWYCPTPAELAWREWGDEVVVFDGVANAVHMVGAATGLVLSCLHGQPQGLTGRAVFEQLFGADGEATDEEQAALIAILTQLQDIGLLAQRAA